MAWVEALADYVAANVGGTVGIDLFVGGMKDRDQQTPTVALATYQGQVQDVMGWANPGVDVPMLQISVRAPDYTAAYDRIVAIRTLLRQLGEATVGGVGFTGIITQGTPNYLGNDAKERAQFSQSMEVYLA